MTDTGEAGDEGNTKGNGELTVSSALSSEQKGASHGRNGRLWHLASEKAESKRMRIKVGLYAMGSVRRSRCEGSCSSSGVTRK